MPETSEESRSSPKNPNHPLRTALLLAGSAAFGGLAVALWHRRTLAQLRKDSAAAGKNSAASEDADEQ
jgi:hypothetical protein